jgi:hypothetical protein
MVKIHGNIGSFSELVKEMGGVYQPSSLIDIAEFKKDFSSKPLQIKESNKKEILNEIENLKNRLNKLSNERGNKLKEVEEALIKEKKEVESKINLYSINPGNIFVKIFYRFKLKRLFARKDSLDNHFEDEKKKLLKELEANISSTKEGINYKEINIDKLVEEMSRPEIEKLNIINSLLLKNNKLYEGAIGEQKVLDELKILPDSFSIINNFYKRFSRGIYQKRNDDWIYSVQIDHIVVGPTGIFIIETKNWSRVSINNEDLFSPVRQVGRAQHALYCYLNDLTKKGYLYSFQHHWGPLQISPRSIVLTLNQPIEQEFQHVKILSLKALVNYIGFGTKIFSESQVNDLVKVLSYN